MADDRGPRPILGERRMSDAEALMWNLEKDPHLQSAFANVTVLDSMPDLDRFRRTMERALHIVPRLRQRVVATLGRLAPPEWVEVDVDIDHHVRRVALPEPGSMRQLLDMAAAFVADPFDRSRPLWEFLLVEGLEGGRTAMLQKLHHTITDGEGGVRMSAEFIDFARDQPERPFVAAAEATPVEPPGSLLGGALEMAAHNARRQLGIGRRLVGDGIDLLAHPDRIPGAAAGMANVVGSSVRQLTSTDRHHSPLWTERSLRHRIEILRIPLDDAKRAAKALGGTVNDLFVAGAAGGAGAYHRAKGVDVDELRVSMPVSMRSDGSMGGNAFALSRALVPVGPDPVERFHAVHERLGESRNDPGMRAVQGLAGLVNLLPTSLLVRVARQQTETIDFATSNVRGAPFDLYIAGAKIEGNYPIGPLAGVAFNLTTLSSSGWLDMGLHIDLAAVDDPELLRSCVEEAYAELLAAD